MEMVCRICEVDVVDDGGPESEVKIVSRGARDVLEALAGGGNKEIKVKDGNVVMRSVFETELISRGDTKHSP